MSPRAQQAAASFNQRLAALEARRRAAACIDCGGEDLDLERGLCGFCAAVKKNPARAGK